MPSSEERLAFLDFGARDLELLAELRPILAEHADALVAAFYRHLLSFPATRELLREPAVKERLMASQRQYLLSLTETDLSEAHLADRRRIGEVHERVGLGTSHYLGAYGLYLSLLTPLVLAFAGDEPGRAEGLLGALHKRVLLDAQLAMDAYMERREQDLEYLTRELSESGRELARDFESQGAELRRASERVRHAERLASIGTLVAGLAHEIGTPMGVIQGHARLLESTVQGEQGQWRLRTIQEQIERISRIMQSLLNMARPSSGRRGPVSLESILESTVSFLSEKLERRGIRAIVDVEDAPSVRGDPERLQQLLLNLMLNAVDAMEGGGQLRLSLATDSSGDALVSVHDTGEGISAADQARIFEPFFTTKPAGEGSGLGLAVAHGIVSDHGGQLSVESEPGKGTTVHIRLPRA